MSHPLGSTNHRNHACGDAAWFFVFTPMMILPIDRQKWRVSGVNYIDLTNAINVRKAFVRNGYTPLLGSTITNGHSYGHVECPFCFLPIVLRFMMACDDDFYGHIRRYWATIFTQNRQSDTQNWYTLCIGGGHYG